MKSVGVFLKDNAKEIFWQLILVILGVLLFFGGRGIELAFVQYFGVLAGLSMLALALLRRGKLRLPVGFFLYGLFILFFLASLVWSEDRQKSFEYLTLFIGGGLFWLSFFNLQKEIGRGFEKLVIILGIVFGGLFLAHKVSGEVQFGHLSLFLPVSSYYNHNHLGDLWAAVLVVVLPRLLKEKKWFYQLLTGLGIFFLAISLSRSAYLALAIGAFYIFWKKGWFIKFRKFFWLFIFLTAVLFLFGGVQKTTLFSRSYFVQAIAGFINNPLGVGVGNFGIISQDSANQLWGMTGFSSFTHNIVLEILTGMGILGVSFVIWLFVVVKDLLKKARPEGIVYQALFFTLGVNFLFDYTYFIPTMLWLWFMSLGLSQNKTEMLLKKSFKGVGKKIKKFIRGGFINFS